MYIHTFFVELSTGVLRTCIALYHVVFDMYIFMHMDALLYDVVSFVRTWMRLMMCCMFVLHVDASSLGCWACGCPLCVLCDVT